MSKIHPSSYKKKMETEQIKIERFQHLDKKNNEYNIYENTFPDSPVQLFQCKKDKQDRIIIVLNERNIAKQNRLNTNKDKLKYLKDFFPKKKDYNTVKSYYDKAFHGEEVQFEIKLNNKWVKTFIQPFKKDSKGNINEIICYTEDITDIKKTQEKLKNLTKKLESKVKEGIEEVEKSNQNLEDIIDSGYEIIISFDERNKILTCGKIIEQLTGFKSNKIVGKNIKETKIFDNAEELFENIEKIRHGKPSNSIIVVLNTKSGSKRTLNASFSSIKKDNSYIGVILIGEDISLQIESNGRFINGYSYYSLGWEEEIIYNLFKDFVEVYCDKGLYITRPNQDLISKAIPSKKIEIMFLKQKNLDEIVNKIKNFIEKNKRSVILLDRADYLISNFNFNKFIKYLYIITDMISDYNSTFILSGKPSFFDEKQLSLIKSELLPIPGQHSEEIKIKDDYYEILGLVNKYNKNNILVEFKKISDELSINRKTLSKKINYLEKQDLIIVKNYGRSKTPYLTEKAKAIINKNS